MFKVKVLNQEIIEKILNMKQVIEAVEDVYKLKAKEEAGLFPMVFHEFERGVADMDIKSGYLAGADIFGLKLVSWYGENSKKSLPLLIGTTMVFDMSTGMPIGLLSAEHITGMRTGAAGAIGAKYLAKKDSKDFLMVGAGHQAPFQIAAMLISMENIERVRIYDPMNYETAKALTLSIRKTLFEKFNIKTDVEFIPVDNIEEAVGLSDVITTATPSRKAMIMKEWLKPGAHISCVGSDMEGKQEIDENIFSVAKTYVDDKEQAINVGEIEKAIQAGLLKPEAIVSEMGAVIMGNVQARTSDDEITVYDTTGIALQDLMVSKLALDIANEKGLGTVVDL